jgi:hypothetical protein
MKNHSPEKHKIKRRDALKNMVWMPLAGYSFFSASSTRENKNNTNLKNSVPELVNRKSNPEDWYKFCRPMLEWLNPYPNINVPEYVEDLIRIAKEMNINTIYHLIDFGGAPLFNGSIEPKSDAIGEWDLMDILEKRLHEEGMYFVGAQFGSHTQSSIAERHPEWIARTPDQKPVYGPGGVPLICFNTGYKDYVGDELSLLVKKYKTDGLYIEGLHLTNCFCESCKQLYQEVYGKPIPVDLPKSHMERSRFLMDAVINFIDSINKKVKVNSPNTIVMACPSSNNGPNGRVDWKKLGEVCDVTSLERMWGHIINYPIWQQGMSVGIMQAEGKKPCFTTAWYAQHVDREYTPRSEETLSINYLESIINGATVQFHTQNGPGEVPDNIPVLNNLYSYTEKIRPWFLSAEKIYPVSLLYDRDYFYPEPHFAGYYKALVYNHIPFRVVSRDEISADFLKSTQTLILPNIIRLSQSEIHTIKEYVKNGGHLIATYKTGFQNENNEKSVIADLLGIKKITGQRVSAGRPGPGETRWSPEYYRKDWNFYFKCKKDSWAEKAGKYSLLTFRGKLLETITSGEAEILASIIEIDKSRQSLKHPVYGFYPGESGPPLIIEKRFGKGKVTYFAAELDLDFMENGNEFVSNILVSGIQKETLPVLAQAPSSVEITYFKIKDTNKLLVHILNMTTNQRHHPDSVNEIFPVSGIILRIKDGQKASSLNGTVIRTELKNGELLVTIPEFKVIDSLVIDYNV